MIKHIPFEEAQHRLKQNKEVFMTGDGIVYNLLKELTIDITSLSTARFYIKLHKEIELNTVPGHLKLGQTVKVEKDNNFTLYKMNEGKLYSKCSFEAGYNLCCAFQDWEILEGKWYLIEDGE